MSLNKTLCDLSDRLRNGQNSRKLEIYLKRSKVCLNVLNILKEQANFTSMMRIMPARLAK